MEARRRSTSPLPLFRQADQWFRRSRAALLEALPCGKGCSHCCIGLFPVATLDAEELQRGLALLPRERRTPIVERAARQTTAIQAAFPQCVPDGKADACPDHFIDEVVSRFEGLPCPALEEDGSCGIYPHRPVTCRTMGIPIENDGIVYGACEVQTSVSIVRLPPALRVEEDGFAGQEAHEIVLRQQDGNSEPEELLLPFAFLPGRRSTT